MIDPVGKAKKRKKPMTGGVRERKEAEVMEVSGGGAEKLGAN